MKIKKREVILVLFILFELIGCNRPDSINSDSTKKVILIGWDGAQREHVLALLNNKKLPNLEILADQGSIVNITITTGATQTKPGWAEILTGYNPKITGVISNKDYKPIPEGYTIFERLEGYLGENNIITIFLGGKTTNIGARGPHRICINCLTRDITTREKTDWWDENTTVSTKNSGEKRKFVQMQGEPYNLTTNKLDLYLTALGNSSNVGSKALDYLEKYKDERFFAFFHFQEPDEPGHIYGENSKEYNKGIKTDDYWLGAIVAKLKELEIYDETMIYVVADHGFDESKTTHNDAPYIFLATNNPKVKNNGDRKDITPTILDTYGFDLETIEPALDGKSLLAK